ncbi:ubox-containing protein substrate of the dot icm secretion system [Stylonychia lemnae]|uniref:Ubox-containing protein substrate of the dot icm secretion system n=1 Tax=Stylonychia lemnae TaxID=5949 RepID=A0A077ZSV8_STYLE|nr:ubox-containing protein substrate of the dot icm secretion system [Stylonychia lemnae]|eukprot:CDW72968.1 ubox-containing protein substrate of the dot icm secretion system [Stylonychia lemnae]
MSGRVVLVVAGAIITVAAGIYSYVILKRQNTEQPQNNRSNQNANQIHNQEEQGNQQEQSDSQSIATSESVDENYSGIDNLKKSYHLFKYECPISLVIMNDPVKTKHGFYFERKEIINWIEKSGTCPLSRKKLTLRDIKEPSQAFLIELKKHKEQQLKFSNL